MIKLFKLNLKSKNILLILLKTEKRELDYKKEFINLLKHKGNLLLKLYIIFFVQKNRR